MNYRDAEKNRMIDMIGKFFNDPGNGLYDKRQYPYVLNNPVLNLWDPIRNKAIDYFKDKNIVWHKGTKQGPNGHLLSSQVACINHLFWVRNHEELATLVLRQIDDKIIKAELIDEGYVAFEYIGEHGIGEKSKTRGSNCTSIDAAMIGSYEDGSRKLFFIEWKYTETYTSESKYCKQRADIYDKLIIAGGSPFRVKEPEIYYYEPFYQMMRQTLLAEECVKYKEEGCTQYQIVHIIPDKNIQLHNNITSPGMKGKNIGEAWENVLKYPRKYKSMSPEQLLNPLKSREDTQVFLTYLKVRYWENGY